MTLRKPKKSSSSSPTQTSFIHFCDHASMTTDGKFNLCGIFEALFAHEMPFHHPQMFVLTRFEFPKGPHEIKMVLMQEDRVLTRAEFNRTSEKDEPQNHIWGVYNLTAENFSPIELKIFDSGLLISERTLPIYRLPKPFKKT